MLFVLLDSNICCLQAIPISCKSVWFSSDIPFYVSFPPGMFYFHLAFGARNKNKRKACRKAGIVQEIVTLDLFQISFV